MDVVQTPNTKDAFFAGVLFWFHNHQAQKVLTVEVHNPASLLVDLTPPYPPHLILGSPGPTEMGNKNTTCAGCFPILNVGDTGGSDTEERCRI